MSAANAAGRPNPYVGPVAYLEGQILYGRRAETMELADLLISRRIVLLYSPSGAGKTSLIRASLCKELLRRARKQLRLSPVLRVNYVTTETTANRYVVSVLRTLEDALPEGERLDDAGLATFTLGRYLDERWGPKTSPDRKLFDVLIFDQFEEIFTLDPVEREAKREFFSQVGEALGRRADDNVESDDEAPRFVRWALFAMREDYIAELDDFRELVPTALATRYRLNLLDREQAREAIQSPAADAGVTFADDAVDDVLDELTSVRVTRPGGRVEERRGEFVEPVQLQVVCRHLWSELVKPETTWITREALENLDQQATAHGEVDAALRAYYDLEVAEAAGGQKARERVIREWVERSLITSAKLRNQMLREGDSSGPVAKAEIDALIDSHILRSEKRGGREWVELTHDRLVPPILASNSEWFSQSLSPLQQQARLWEDARRMDGYLLTGRAFKEAEAWARTNPEALQESERAFLDASRAQRRQSQLALLMFVTFLAVVGVMGLRGYVKNLQLERLNEQVNTQERLAAVRTKLALADHRIRSDFRVALERALDADRQIDAALTAVRESREGGDSLNAIGRRVLAIAGAAPSWIQWALAVQPPAGSEDETAALGQERTSVEATLLDALRAAPPVTSQLRGHGDAVRFVSFGADGKRLLSGGYDGRVMVWNLETGTALGVGTDTRSKIYAFAYDPKSGLVATGDAVGSVRLWRLDAAGALQELSILNGDRRVHAQRITGLAFSPDGHTLASVSWDRQLALWDVRDPERNPEAFASWDLRESGGRAKTGAVVNGRRRATPIYAIAYSPDGRRLATADWAGEVIVFDALPTPGDPRRKTRMTELDAYMSEDRDKDTDNGDGQPIVLYAVAFSPDGRWVAAGGHDGSVMLWDASAGAKPGSRLRGVDGHTRSVFGVAFSPNGETLASVGLDKVLILWDVAAAKQWNAGSDLPIQRRIVEMPEWLYSVTYPPSDSRHLAVGGARTILLVDSGGPESPLARPLPVPEPAASGRQPPWEGTIVARAGGAVLATRGDEVWRWRLPPAANDLSKVEAPPAPIALHPDLRRIAADDAARRFATGGASFDDPKAAEVVLWQPDGNGQLERYRVWVGRGRVSALAMSRDGRLLAAAADQSLYIWDVADPRAPRALLQESLESHKRVRALAFSPTDDLLAAAGAGLPLTLWRVAKDGAVVASHGDPARQSVISAIQFAPDGKTLVVGDEDMRVTEWEVAATLVPGEVVALHERGVVSVVRAERPESNAPGANSAVRADRDGRRIVFSSDRSGSLIAKLGPDEKHVRTLVSGMSRLYISGDASGQRLVTTGDDILLWDLRPSRLRLEGCRAIAVADENGDDPCNRYRH